MLYVVMHYADATSSIYCTADTAEEATAICEELDACNACEFTETMTEEEASASDLIY